MNVQVSAGSAHRAFLGKLGAFSGAFISVLVFGATGLQAAPLYDEITVTARRVDENLQGVPVAVSPFTKDYIEELNLQSIDDIALFTPGFSFTSAFGRQPGSDRPTMRGISTIQNGIANASSVSYFVDGIYLGGSPQSTELANIERVEVLRGPQAAQLGRGTYVGAINYVTRKPTEEFETFVEVKSGEDGLFGATSTVSGPLSDQIGFFVAGGFENFDGQYTNQRDGSKVGGEQGKDVTVKLFWQPTDNFDATFKMGYQETNDDHFPIYLQPRALNNDYFRVSDPMDPDYAPRAREYYVGVAQPDPNGINLVTDLLDKAGGSGVELERIILSGSVNYTFGNDMTLSVLAGLVDDNIQTGFDVSYAGYDPIPFGSFAGQFFQFDRDDQEDKSLEVRLTSSRDNSLRWTGGAYYYEGKASEQQTSRVLDDMMGGVNVLPIGVADLTDEKIENIAVFGGVDLDITDRLTLGAELRYAEDKITVENFENDGTFAFIERFSDTFESFTPRVTLVWALNDDINIYGNISKGTKPGDFNSSVPNIGGTMTPDESLRAVDEEIAWNYEVGAKTSVLGGRGNVNVALYYLKVDDQQLTQVYEIPMSGGLTDSLLQNVGKTEVLGLELESVFSITDNWRGGLTYAYTDSEIKERISSDQADLLGSDGSTAQEILLGDVSGKESPRVPKNQISLWTRYEREFSSGSLWYVGADWAYEDSKYAQEHNLIETGERNIVGARIGVKIDELELELWGRNIFDDDTPVDILRYIDRRSGTFPPGNGSTSPRGFGLTLPRQQQFGLTARVRFGG